jgi:hypothetical protein
VATVGAEVTLASPGTASRSRFGPWQREWQAFLELFAVCGMTVARPTLGILGNNVAIFVTRQTRPAELVGLTLVLVLVPPLALWLVEVVIGAAAPTARRAVHIALVAIVAGVFVVATLKKQTALGPVVLVVLAVAAAAAGAWLLWRFAAASLFLRYLAIAPVLFAVLFLTSGSVGAAVFDPEPPAAHVAIERPKRVVFVVMDEFPLTSLLDGTGHVDRELFPNFAALADGSTWYRNTTTVAPYTGAAVPAILTGQYHSGAPDVSVAANTPHNLFTLLGGTYSMNVDEQGTRLCPTALCAPDEKPTADRLSDLVSVSRELWWQDASPERAKVDAFAEGDILGDPHALATGDRFVSNLRPTTKPRLDYLHVELPHQPWHYLPTGQDYLQGETSPGLWWDYTWGTKWAGDLARQRHLLQVAAADRLLGSIVHRLRAIGAYDDTLLVVTADHGVAFGEREPIRGLAKDNLDQILWVPLFVKAPGQVAGKIDDRHARSIDILPTIADTVDARIPWKVDGRSLVGPPRADGPLRVLDWGHNVLQPRKDGFVHVPDAGFDDVLRARAAPADGAPADRLYRVGPYRDLLGRDATPLMTARSDGSFSLDDPGRFAAVQPDAHRTPWAYVAGSVRGVAADAPLAVVVDGRVAGLSGAYQVPPETRRFTFWTVADPARFRAGTNRVVIAEIRGSPEAPVLAPLRLSR